MHASPVQMSFAILALIAANCNPVAAQDQDGYVPVKGDQKVLALRGVLLRIPIGKITTRDGFKTTVYRDVDYPIREVVNPDDPEDVAVSIFLGPRYNDPPLPGKSSPPERVRRPVLEPITYSGKIMFRDAEEFEVELKLDYSGNRVRVSGGSFLDVENGAVPIAASKEPESDFEIPWHHTLQGGFATAQKLASPPDELQVWLRGEQPLRSAFADNEELSEEDRPLTTQTTVFIKLKKQKPAVE
ncbi:MAG: hypothetical protein IAF94_03365 [Pirellulaceae bacterium]|nr:hypothetical protein [Pirellulaceae bacterium]